MIRIALNLKINLGSNWHLIESSNPWIWHIFPFTYSHFSKFYNCWSRLYFVFINAVINEVAFMFYFLSSYVQLVHRNTLISFILTLAFDTLLNLPISSSGMLIEADFENKPVNNDRKQWQQPVSEPTNLHQNVLHFLYTVAVTICTNCWSVLWVPVGQAQSQIPIMSGLSPVLPTTQGYWEERRQHRDVLHDIEWCDNRFLH